MRCGCCSSGRAEERKGLPVLLSAFEALVEHVPSRLTVVGADREEVFRMVADPEVAARIDVLGKVSDGVLWRHLGEADVLCAPSLAGESFGMVLIEAFAAGTPVVASHIAGYSDVVTNGVDGLLVPPADPQALAEELQILSHEPERLAAMGEAGRISAERYAWPRIADEVTEVYERAMEPVNGARLERRGRRPAGRPGAARRPAQAAERRSFPRSSPRPPPAAAAAPPAGSPSGSPASSDSA